MQSGLSRTFWSAFFALICLCAMPSVSFAQTVQYTNTTDSAPGEITATTPCSVAAAFQRDFVVSDDFVVDDVNIGLLLAHANRGEWASWLRSPAGTIVRLKNTTGGAANNINVLFDDGAASSVDGHTVNDTATATTSVPPYQRTFRPNEGLNASFGGQSSFGTWTLFVCDFNNNGVNGTFYQSDLYLTPATNIADLSLNKTVASGSPSTAVYTLTVTNAVGSDLSASGITVRDILPAGVSFDSASGTGSYNAGTSIWTLGTTLAPGQSASIDISVNITGAPGTSITNEAEIISSSVTDPDSTPNNGVTTEDDYSSVTFTVGGRIPGIPPSIGAICSAAGAPGTTTLDWNTQSWTTGSSTGSANVTNLGTVNFSVATQGTYNAPLALTLDNNGGLGSAGLSLFQSIEYTNISQVTTTTVTLPTAVDGAQFTVFDIDFADLDFADRLQVSGSFNGGTPFFATLTNGSANYISGNDVIGDALSGSNDDDGNVVATFSQPVDTITIEYGNHTTAPPDPDGQAISLHDFTFCRPVADLSVTKVSNVVSDGVSGTNPKAVPGAILRYCILISNAGSATTTNVSATDNLPAGTSFVAGSMLSGSSCSGTTTAEDDDSSGADESDPFGMSVAGSTITGTANSLSPGGSMAMIFNVTLD